MEKKLIDGEEHTAESIVKKHLGVIGYYARRYSGVASSVGLSIEDMESEFRIAIFIAFQEYDSSKTSSKFMTYAKYVIIKQLDRVIRSNDAGLKYPRTVKEFARQIRKAELKEREPEEIAEITGLELQQVKDALEYMAYNRPERLDKSVHQDGKAVLLSDLLAGEEDETEEMVKEFETTLDDRQKTIFRMLMDGYSQREIGPVIGVSQVHVSRINKKIRVAYDAYKRTLKYV